VVSGGCGGGGRHGIALDVQTLVEVVCMKGMVSVAVHYDGYGVSGCAV
jgi:hypothetical protein